jgi:hypothetical protein
LDFPEAKPGLRARFDQALLASPLHELTGFYLAVDCLAPRCNGERSFAVCDLLWPRHDGGAGAAPHAVLRRL